MNKDRGEIIWITYKLYDMDIKVLYTPSWHGSLDWYLLNDRYTVTREIWEGVRIIREELY